MLEGTAEIAWVGLGLAQNGGVQQFSLVGQAELLHLAYRQLLQVLFAQRPELVVIARKKFQPQPDCVGVGHHIGAPVVEHLQAADLDAGFLDVDPVVGYVPRLATHLGAHAAVEEPDGDEVAVLQPGGDRQGRGVGCWAQSLHQLPDGHGGHHRIGVEALPRTLRIAGDNAFNAPVLAMNFVDRPTAEQSAATALEFRRRGLPHLAGAVLGIKKTLDQRGVLRIGLARDDLLERLLGGTADRQALDALRAPVGADVAARNTPDLLGVVLEELAVELAAEAVDEEVFQRLFGLDGAGRGGHVAAAELEAAPDAHLAHEIQAGFERIVEEVATKVDARLAAADQQHGIVKFAGGGFVAAQQPLLPLIGEAGVAVAAGRLGDWQHVAPPPHDPVRLGEEAVPADVDPVALEVDGLGDASNLLGGLQNGDLWIAGTLEFEASGEAGGTGADDERMGHQERVTAAERVNSRCLRSE
mmetsp:Transcript_37521/g.87502  ORF Transcript_37521/g.87502 Transcript_37521/m.87502 type:complete len:471 (-) Transcript_37521:643-2055(-)